MNMIQNSKFLRGEVIVVGGGSHHNTLGVIRAIGESGYECDLITYGKNPSKHYVSSSRYVSKFTHITDLDALVSLLRKKTSETGNRRVIISCTDAVTEILNNNFDELSDRYLLPGVNVQGAMNELMDKTCMIRMVGKRGILSPHVWNIPDDYSNIEYPCITKSHLSSHGGKVDVLICYNKEQLDAFLSDNKDDIFVQPFIDKMEEVQFIGCSLRGGEEVIVPGMSRVLRSQPNTNTGFLEYGPVESFYQETVDKAKLYIKDCKYSGLFSFEIIRGKDDKVYFLEINFRNDGNAWCVTKAGVNLPVIWVKSCLNEDYTSEIRPVNKIVMMPEFQDIKLVLQRKVSLIQWIKDWKRTDYFMEYDKNDPKPFWQFIKDRIL